MIETKSLNENFELSSVENKFFDAEQQTETFLKIDSPEEDLANSEKSSKSVWKEAKLFINLAVPTTATNVISNTQWLVTSTFTGRYLGSEALAAIALANLAGNLLGRSFGLGLLSAADTLLGRAMGEKNHRELGLIIQRAFFLILIVSLFCFALWINIMKIFIFFRQPEDVSVLAASFLRFYILVFLVDMMVEMILRFYRSQNICLPFTCISAVVMCFHFVFVHMFIRSFNFDGLILAHFSTSLSYLLLSLIYITIFKPHHPDSLKHLSLKESLDCSKLKRFLSLGLPGIFSMSQWWFFEVQIVLIGMLGETSLAVHSIVYNLIPVAFTVYFGITSAAQTRISTLLAKKRSKTAKNVAKCTFVVDFIFGCLFSLVSLKSKDFIISFFLSNESGRNEAVLDLISQVWLISSLYLIPSSIFGASLGIFRGAGLHGRLSSIMTVVLWFFGLPLEIYLGFYSEMKLFGIYLGMFWIYCIMDVVLVVDVLKRNWKVLEQY